jgi:hypothetical protein
MRSGDVGAGSRCTVTVSGRAELKGVRSVREDPRMRADVDLFTGVEQGGQGFASRRRHRDDDAAALPRRLLCFEWTASTTLAM